MKRLLKNAAAVLVAGTALASTSPAFAEIKVGTLNCEVSGGIGLILGSSKEVYCTFSQTDGLVERYAGSIKKFGLDIGVTGKAYLSWVVFAPGTLEPGALSGSYAGGTAEASVGVGAGAHALIGGFEGSVTLQPVSVQVQSGLNVAAGVGSLELHPAN